MPKPNSYHALPEINPSSVGKTQAGGEGDIYKSAELIRPGNTALEQKVATMSRVAVRLLDRATGKASELGLSEGDIPVIGAAGKLPASILSTITATDISDSTAAGRSLITAESVTAQRNLLIIKPIVTNYAIFGDSRAAQSGTNVTVPANGISYWFELATQNRLKVVINPSPLGVGTPQRSFSQGGQKFGTLNNDAGANPRVAELITTAPPGTVILMYCGTNGLNNPTGEFADFQAVTQRFIDAGHYPVAYLEPWFGASAVAPLYQVERQTYNASVQNYCVVNNIPFVDGMELFSSSDLQSFDTVFYSDGGYVHPNIKGCSLVGTAFARAIKDAFDIRIKFPVDYQLIKQSISINQGWLNGLTGNGTSTGFIISPVNCNLASALVRRVDGQAGHWANLTITNCVEGAAAASAGAGYVDIYNSLTGANLPPNDGSSYYGVCELQIEEIDELSAAATFTNFRYATLTLTASGGVSQAYSVGSVASNVAYQTHTVGNRQSVNPLNMFDGTYKKRTCLITPLMVFPTGTTTFGLNLRVYGNCIIKVGNIGIVKA